MNRQANYGPKTSVTSFLVSTRGFLPDGQTFTRFRVQMTQQGVRTPRVGVVTMRLAAAAADFDVTTVGTLRINVQGLPVPSQSVVQQIAEGAGTTMAYIPVEFSDRSSETDQDSQPVVQLLNNVDLNDLEIDLTFKPLRDDEAPIEVKSLNMMMVLETDGSRRANHTVFTQ